MATYLVTGAAGFIGARTVHFLLREGHRVVAIDNLNDYYDIRLKAHRLECLAADWADNDALDRTRRLRQAPTPENARGCSFSGENLHFQPTDIEDRQAICKLFAAHDFDAVLNLAARAGVRASMETPEVYYTTNVLGSLHLLEAMRQHKTPKYVLASTSSLYAGQPMPFVESLPVNEPISPYAASKKAAEVMAYTWHNLYGIDVTVVRYFTVYGPAGRPDMSPLRFCHWIATGQALTLYGDGEQARDFTHVDDIARGTIAALKPLGFSIINLGGGNQPISINTMIRHFEHCLGRPAVINHQPFHAADMQVTWANIARANNQLAWEPRITFEQGIDELAAWYKDNADWLALLTY